MCTHTQDFCHKFESSRLSKIDLFISNIEDLQEYLICFNLKYNYISPYPLSLLSPKINKKKNVYTHRF